MVLLKLLQRIIQLYRELVIDYLENECFILSNELFNNKKAKSTKNYFNWIFDNYNDEIKRRIRTSLPINFKEED